MDAEPLAEFIVPGPEGLAFDLPCPKCEYNLRGLTVPRCPECGFAFAWEDVPGWLAVRSKSGDEPCALFVGVLGFFALAGLAMLAGTGEAAGLLLLPIPIVLAFAIAALQAGVEFLIVSAGFLLPGRKRFRAWWEGVLVGYGLCGLTCLALGRPMIMLPGAEARLSPGSCPTLLILVIGAIESFLVQWWVVRRRCRQWEDPIPGRRLALACLVAKAFVAIPWTLIATGAMAR